MARVYFNVMCNAKYNTSLYIPDEMVDDEGAVLDYISDHIDICNVNDLEWVSDEAVYSNNISCIENDDGESIGFLENLHVSPERNIETNDIKELF